MQQVVLLALFFLVFPTQFVQAIGIRNPVPAELLSRCKALAVDIQTFPQLVQEEHATRFAALQICKPEFKVWFWQSVDDKTLVELEHSVAQSKQVLLQARQRNIAIQSGIVVILLLAVIIRQRTCIARIWRAIRTNPGLCVIKILTPFCYTLSELRIFMQTLGVVWSILSTLWALLCSVVVCRIFFFTSWDFIVFFQIFAIVFYAWNYAQYVIITSIVEGGDFVLLRDVEIPFRNILEGEREREVQDLLKAVVSLCIGFF